MPAALKCTSLTDTVAWKALESHHHEMTGKHMRSLFGGHPRRFDHFSLCLNDLLLDYSKNLLTSETMKLLLDLARQANVEGRRDAMLAGEHINQSEDRAAMHTALRMPTGNTVMVDGENIMIGVRDVLGQIRAFSVALRGGIWKGHSAKPICDIVNIGIGGSDLGPAMVCEALGHYHKAELNAHFVSNVDGSHMAKTLKNLNPETTLFIIASKSFTTQETMCNAATARAWITDVMGETAVSRHFVALSANRQAVVDFGIASENMFRLWDWVGGRYSLWSAIGLSIAVVAGIERFEELLAGAHFMDVHFASAPLAANMPVIMAMVGIWNCNFLGARSHAILPYDQYLQRLPSYIQQLEMESNGKSLTLDGEALNYHTCPVIFGAAGTNGQHAFYQLLHQGTHLVSSDFIAAVKNHNSGTQYHAILLANFLAQTQALMMGKNNDNNPHKAFAGNRPSNSILVKKFDARTIGMLLALYEHKTFVQGIVWRINSFDQFGVELGKSLAADILPQLTDDGDLENHDASTRGLINHYKKLLSDGK